MMKINKKVLISVFVVSCVVLISVLISLNQSVDKEQKDITSKERQPLQLTIKPVKKVCELKAGDCGLEIIVAFKNIGNEPILLAHPESCVPDSWKGDEGETYNISELIGKSELTCLITLPNGRQISLLNIEGLFDLYGAKGIVNEDGSISGLSSFYLDINPSESKEVILSKFGHEYALPFWMLYPPNKDYPFGKPITEPLFPLEGSYQISLTYKNVLSRAVIYDEKEGKVISVWTGNLTSNTIEINVIKEK